MEVGPSLLCVILDLSPLGWHDAHGSLDSFFSHFLVFLNTYLAQQAENSLAVFAAFPGESCLLYSSNDDPIATSDESPDANWYLPFKTVDHSVVTRIRERIDASTGPQVEVTALVGALVKALCYINRALESAKLVEGTADGANALPLDPRVLIVSISSNESTAYVPLMNAIFSAQKLKVIIDVCRLGASTAVFLQQAAYLTKGAYIEVQKRDALLQTLMMCFLSTPSMRTLVAVPLSDKVDFRAACFCHQTVIEVGFVCSVCLSIFCGPLPVCTTCKTKFPIKLLQKLTAAKAVLKILNAQPNQNNGHVNGVNGVR